MLPNTDMILECRGIFKSYNGKNALDGLDLSLCKGKIVGLLGPSGSGKTTLIKVIMGLLTLDAGSVLIDNQPPNIKTKEYISYLPERNSLCGWMSISDMISLFEDFYSDFDRKKASDMLKHLALNPKSKFSTLSKGTREKVQLMLTMSRNARLYLLDEPIGGVDPAAREYILRTIISNYSENATVIICTHLIHDVERVLDEVVFIDQGKTVLHSSIDLLRENESKSIEQLFQEVFRC